MIRKILLVFLMVLSTATWAQTTDSPYSFYGLGDENTRALSYQRAMGGAGVALFTPQFINPYNPASYAGLQYTTFAVDANLDFKTIRSDLVSQKTNKMYFNNLAIAFPVGRRGGFAASLRQYTKIGYDITVTENDQFLGEYQFQYDGEGGINQFTLGAGYSILYDTNNILSVGANMQYYFGFAQTNRRTTNFADAKDALSSNQSNRTSINDFSFDLGLYYRRRINSDLKISIAADYSPNIQLKAKNNNLTYTYRSVNGDESIKDTVSFTSINGFASMPSVMHAGMGFYLGKSWQVFTDYRIQDWSELEILGNNQNLKSRTDLMIGIQLHPDAKALAKYFKSVRYKAGFRLTETRLNVRNTDISEYAITAGLGLPIMKTKTKSSINFGIEFGQRGTTENGLVNENFTNVFLGLSFNPHKFDGWFKKSKYN
jgi:hypothetical protein